MLYKRCTYIQKCWNYMIAQNVGNEDGISTGLDAMHKHPFGDHSSCGDWCSHRENPDMNYKSLPHGKCLSDSNLQRSLLDLFSRYKGICKKLAHMGSTQANESLNMTIASKAPKRCHFSESASLGYRVAAGVAQKNIGHSYVAKVNIRAGLSPGTYTHRLAVLRDLQHRKRKVIANTVKAKRRRINLKAHRLQRNACQEKKEGPTYFPEIGLCQQADTTLARIPKPLIPPVPEAAICNSETHVPVYFNLEITGLERTCHIAQLAFLAEEGEFKSYVLPKLPVSKEAQKTTLMTKKKMHFPFLQLWTAY